MTFILNSSQDGENLSKHTEKYVLTLCKTNGFQKADFLMLPVNIKMYEVCAERR